MPDDLRAVMADVTIGDCGEPEKIPEALRTFFRARKEGRAAWQALQEAYLEQVEAINRECGLNAAEEASDARFNEMWDIGRRIFAMPANTFEGMAIKIRAADRLEIKSFSEDYGEIFPSIAGDIGRLAAGGA